MKITSVNNDLVKNTAKLLQKKYREETGLFLIEGFKGVEEAINSEIKIKTIFLNEKSNFKIKNKDVEIILTTEAVLSKMTDTKTAPDIVAVAKQPVRDINKLKEMKKIVLLENISDAGNLGTIIRSSSAFNIDGIVLYGNTVDLFNPKTVRSTVGNLWKTPVFKIDDFNTLQKHFYDFERIATLPKGNSVINLKEYRVAPKILLMFGTESSGLSNELKEYATKNLTIEMSDKVESLNLSVAASIILYQIYNNQY